MPDVGSRVTDPTTSRRGVLVGIAGMAATTAGCANDSVPGTRSADAASSGLPSNTERTAKGEETTTAVAPANAAEVVPPAPSNNSASQAPVTRMTRLATAGVTQPFFADDNDRILFYDQPAPGQGGMFVIGPQEVEPRRERAEWGYMLGAHAFWLHRGSRDATRLSHTCPAGGNGRFQPRPLRYFQVTLPPSLTPRAGSGLPEARQQEPARQDGPTPRSALLK